MESRSVGETGPWVNFSWGSLYTCSVSDHSCMHTWSAWQWIQLLNRVCLDPCLAPCKSFIQVKSSMELQHCIIQTTSNHPLDHHTLVLPQVCPRQWSMKRPHFSDGPLVLFAPACNIHCTLRKWGCVMRVLLHLIEQFHFLIMLCLPSSMAGWVWAFIIYVMVCFYWVYVPQTSDPIHQMLFSDLSIVFTVSFVCTLS